MIEYRSYLIVPNLVLKWKTLLKISRVCGETGIRTPDTLLEYTRFPGVPLQPLEHLSLVDFAGIAHGLSMPPIIFRLQK